MNNSILLEATVIFLVLYIIMSLIAAKIGASRRCGSEKALFFSIVFTPLFGFFYVFSSRHKNLIKIVHYSCPKCGLEYTDGHKYCPLCSREGELTHLHKISMIAY
ncbi:MAG: zinc ribbon domain-containing protein [Bacteroidales bacterium]